MKSHQSNEQFDELISRAVSRERPTFDFDKWKQKHKDEIQVFKSQTAGEQTLHSPLPFNIWRTIMKSRITKLAAAALVIIAVFVGVHYSGGSIDPATIAWADVTQRVTEVDYIHFYYLKSRNNRLTRQFEGWYAHGKMVIRGDSGDTTYDDGQTLQGFDGHKRRTVKRPSNFAEGRTFLEVFSGGLLSDENEQFSQQMPTNVGDDFLIYKFDPPSEDSDWIESLFVTVGKNSLLPVQMKVYHKDQDYDLVIFDYEAPEKPAEFFEPPTTSEPPHGAGEVVLDGEEVMIDITGAPGIKTAVVRLHSKSSDSSGEPTFLLDVAFIIEEGYKSITNDLIRLKLNEAKKCGLGADNWPDGKYRNIRFTPLLKPTEKEDTCIVEISCWLRTEEDRL
jgi:hypothetical protein